MLAPLQIPNPQPARKVPGYQMPETSEALLQWDFVSNQADSATYYWIACVNKRNGPHVAPLWGIWHENRVHFDGSPHTGWAQNLRKNPQIVVHLPSAEQVVVIEGSATTYDDDALSEEEWAILDGKYRTKYSVAKGSPYWYVEPRKILAWNGGDLKAMTRWLFQ
jgi:general stress protein 26